MSLTVHPGTVEGTVQAPPSKSITHRALFASLLAKGGTVASPLWSEDTRASLAAIEALGAQTIATDVEAVVRGGPVEPGTVDARNSGTTLRLATAIAALADGTSRLAGDDSLNRRPMGPLLEALEQLGATVEALGDGGSAPVEVTGPIEGGKARMPGDVSSQFVSGLLLAGPLMEAGLTLELTTPLTSAPYVELTIRVLDRSGIEVQRDEEVFRVEPGAFDPVRHEVPGDYSAAAFPLLAGAIAGGGVTVRNLPPDTGQGDEAVAELFEAFGVDVTRKADTLGVQATQPEAARLDLGETPDLFPPLAVLAACAEGQTVLEGAPHLREKESDRIQAMVDGLSALGVEAEGLDDGARITGGPIEGGRVDARGDHRIQMAFAVAALAAEGPVTIEGPTDAHAVSYPGFRDALETLGARIEREHAKEAEPTEGTR